LGLVFFSQFLHHGDKKRENFEFKKNVKLKNVFEKNAKLSKLEN
jgi:hypothetical protein